MSDGSKARVVRVGRWTELPEVLEPGVYIVDGEEIVVRERVSRDALKRTLLIMKRRGGVYA